MRVPTGHVSLPTQRGVVPQTAALGTLAGDGPRHLLEALVLRAEQRPLVEAAEVGGIVVPEEAVEWPVAVDGVAHKDVVVAVDV